MLTKIQKWGNSQGFRIPKELLNDAHISIGDSVNVVVENGKIVIVPERKIRNRFDINFLTKGKIEKDEEYDFGKMGKETW
jgi:antitoxin MazE